MASLLIVILTALLGGACALHWPQPSTRHHAATRAIHGSRELQRRINPLFEEAYVEGGLQPLPADRGPRGSGWNNSIAMCSMILDENATDVREWLLYHRWLGVDHVYLTENQKTKPEHMAQQLQDFVDDGFLTYTTEPLPNSQLKVVRDCIKMHYHKHNWLGFIDVDEFLVLRNRDEELKEVLDDYKHEAGLSVNWVLVGSSGRVTRPRDGGVLQHYPQCAGRGHHNVKTFANTFFLENIANHPHNFAFRDDRHSVNENHTPTDVLHDDPLCIPNLRAKQERRKGKKVKAWRMFVPSRGTCFMIPAATHGEKSVERLALYHYGTRSAEDMCNKLRKPGSAMSSVEFKGWDYFLSMNTGVNKTGGMCALPAELGRACCPAEQLVRAIDTS